MKLSDAMVMGDTLRKRDWVHWLDLNKSCGCAFGGALLAIGKADEFLKVWKESLFHIAKITPYWPWLTEEMIWKISHQFRMVCEDKQTFEELIAYVRSIEPNDDEEIVTVEAADAPQIAVNI